ncbi:MAG: tryptophan-rich sensory protein [Pseudomonadota bacterium]
MRAKRSNPEGLQNQQPWITTSLCSLLAAVEVLVLLVLIAATMRSFWQIDRLAAVLLLPYLL